MKGGEKMKNISLKEVIHDINCVISNSPNELKINLIFGIYSIDPYRTIEGSYYAFFPSLEIHITKEKINYLDILSQLAKKYPEIKYEIVELMLQIHIENAKIYREQFKYAKVIEYNKDPVYPKNFKKFFEKIRTSLLENYRLFKSITLETQVII